MEAVFVKPRRVLFAVSLIFSFMWPCLCVYMFIKNRISTVGDIFACAFLTLLFFAFAIIPYLYNYKAYLHIDDNQIVGRFGFFRRVEIDIADVTFVRAQINTLHIILKDRKYYIGGIQNSHAVSTFIQQRMLFSPCDVTEEVIESTKKRIQNRKKNIILAYCTVGLSFVWLFITIFLTGARDLPEFGRVDWIIFGVMWVLEIPTVIAMFVFAVRSGKDNLKLEQQIYELKRSVLESTPLLFGPGYLKAVLTDSDCSRRVTVYCGCVENDPLSACCNIEIFDENYRLSFLYQTEIFTLENLDEPFEGLLDLTDKFKQTNI